MEVQEMEKERMQGNAQEGREKKVWKERERIWRSGRKRKWKRWRKERRKLRKREKQDIA